MFSIKRLFGQGSRSHTMPSAAVGGSTASDTSRKSVVDIPGIPAVTSAPANAKQAIYDFLKLEGCAPNFDSDGDITFQHKDFTLVVIFDARDGEYLRLVLPNFWSLDSDAERRRAHMVADKVNREIKGVKVFAVKDKHTWAAVELFIAEPQTVIPVLLRCAGALHSAAMLFSLRMLSSD